MKTDLLAQTTDDACESTDSTSEYSLVSTESPYIENMEKLREKISNQDAVIRDLETKLTDAENNILNQNEKIKLYEAIIKDKNDLIELMKETKELGIKQLNDEIADLQSALDLSKTPTSNENEANAAESAEFEKKLNENENFQTLQKQFAESQSQIETLKDLISQLKPTNELMNYIKELVILKQRSDSEQSELRAKIAELEKKTEIYEAKSKEEEAKLAKYASNAKSGQSTDAPFVLLNHSKMANIKCIQIENQKAMVVVEHIPLPFVGPDWVVILRRFDGSVSFDSCLSEGIGDLSGEYWLGLELIRKLTSSIRHELYIELVDFDDVTAYARYDNFVIGSKSEGYAMKSLGAYSGNAGDALRSHENCKTPYTSNRWWWWSSNNQCCLTGIYKNSREKLNGENGMYWGNWHLGKKNPLKACKMLIRPH